MKYLKIGKYELYAVAIIVFATGLRMLLTALGFPSTNSDEGTMGIMALHVAYHGEHPLFFYGQDYMGSLEAYLAALFIHLLGGPSLFALRLGVILLVMLFFVSTYLLTSMLFSKQLGLVTLVLLSVGSVPYLTRQMIATGGSSQTLLFGSLAFLFATSLALTYHRGASLRIKLWRLAGYFCWGLVVGLGMWSDMVVLPFLTVAGLFLLLFCWRNLLWSWVGVVAGFLIGMLPSLRYSMLHHLNPLSVVLGLFQGTGSQAPRTLSGIIHGLHETLFVSLPTATGNPFCPIQELPFLSDNTPRTRICEAVRGTWGTGYVILLGLALLLTLITFWRLRFRSETEMSVGEKRRQVVRYSARLALLSTGAVAIMAYAISSAPVSWPGFHARYLIGLLIITPAVIEPLWTAASQIQFRGRLARITTATSRSLLVIIVGILLTGTIIAFSEVPAAQTINQQRAGLVNDLLRIGATHIYTDYWSCNNIAFASNERIICGVINGELQPSHNRDPHYFGIVSSDPHAAYVYPKDGQMPEVEHKVQQSNGHYRRYDFDGYIVYQPILTG